MQAQPPKSKKELQRFLGHVNYLQIFISNLASKSKEFSNLLKIKVDKEFEWKEQHQVIFEKINEYLVKPLLLMPPRDGYPLRLYILAWEESIGCALAQQNIVRHK